MILPSFTCSPGTGPFTPVLRPREWQMTVSNLPTDTQPVSGRLGFKCENTDG